LKATKAAAEMGGNMRITRIFCAGALFVAVSYISGGAQQAAPSVLGQWHQPASDQPCRRGAFETWFNFTGLNQDGILSGTYRIACANKSGYLSTDGTLTSDTPVAKASGDGTVTVTIGVADGTGKVIYTFHPAGRTAPGTMITRAGTSLPLNLEKL
jgi:hypothetical protein